MSMKSEVIRSERKGDVIVRTVRLSPILKDSITKDIKLVRESGHKRVLKPKVIKPSMDTMAGLIMQKIFFHKDLGVNITPKEYDQLNKVVKFSATTPDGKTKYNFSGHVLDLQARIDKGTLVSIAMVS